MSLDNTSSAIQQVIAVMSGKGGVGKSTVTGLLAVVLQRRGLRVGILDGDLNGPAIVRIFGTPIEISLTDDGRTEPLRSSSGIAMMGINVFLEDQSDPITWRGPMLASAFRQFYSDVAWGQLDLLLVDVPTGTADVPLAVLEFLPLTGALLVTTPQTLAAAVLAKCVKMIRQHNVTITGLVENMTYLALPGQGNHDLFGASRFNDLPALAGIPFLGRLPFDPALTALCDAGAIEQYDAEIAGTLAANLLSALDIPALAHR